MADIELTTNLSQLPYGLFSQLARQIDSSENFWRELFSDEDRNSPYFLRLFILVKMANFLLNFQVRKNVKGPNEWLSLGPICSECWAIEAKLLKVQNGILARRQFIVQI
jgi:hypothetical protein